MSVAQNCLKYGVGAINIDECRVGSETIPEQKSGTTSRAYQSEKTTTANGICQEHIGRFPANVITDGSVEVAQGMPDTKSQYNSENKHEKIIHRENADILKYGYAERYETGFNDSGSALRYFYTAKASKKDRDDGLMEFEERFVTDGCERNNHDTAHMYNASSSSSRRNSHPTVKPVELMQYLVRLVSPRGSVILDCFMGSGSTGKAVMFENRERDANYKFVGIEMTDEYLPIAKARIDYALNEFEYELKKERITTGQLNLFDL